MEDHDNTSTEQSAFTARHVAISVIPHFTGFMSVLGSLWIIIDVLRDRQKKLGNTYHRLLLGMSLSDVMGSVAMALSTWPIPSADSGVVDGGSVFGASGTQATCSAQGFFVQVGMAAPLYTAFLSLYYLLMVRYNWSKQSQKMRILETCAHAFCWTLSLGTSFASLGLKLYNSANIWCWIAPLPLDCVSSAKSPTNEGTCIRGDNAWIYRLAFYFIWIWLALLCVAVNMGMVFWTVYNQTRTMSKYNHKGVKASVVQRQNVERVATQATLYVGAFLLTIIFPSIVRMTQAKWNCTSEFFPLSILTVTFYPCQGFWNFFIYMRPKYVKHRKEHPDWSVVHVFLQVTICCGRHDKDETTTTSYALGKSTAQSNKTIVTSQVSFGVDQRIPDDPTTKESTEKESPST